MLDGTSLASLVRTNGQRHVFFQDQKGRIREAIYQSDSGWAAPTSYVVATDARNNTPLAAFNVPASGLEEVESLHLFYVNTSGFMSSQTSGDVDWVAVPATQLANTSYVTVSHSARSFSLSFNQPNISANFTVIVLYEDGDSNYNAIYGISDSGFIRTWFDAGLSTVDLKGFSIQGPVAQCFGNEDWGNVVFGYEAYAAAFNGTNHVTMQLSSGTFSTDGIPTGGGPLGLIASPDQIVSQSFISSDLTCSTVYSPSWDGFGPELSFWVNGTVLQQYNTRSGLIPMPSFSFPNLRLSAFTPINSTQLLLYNQFNKSLISEHMYDTSIGHWTSNNVSIEIE
ncbi:MAG: hypothetical protein M1822_008933 [Bathelium mastoideum]|nr:MAG: hypothetical protein M1822_008933 [Bathelium mastoideum]